MECTLIELSGTFEGVVDETEPFVIKVVNNCSSIEKNGIKRALLSENGLIIDGKYVELQLKGQSVEVGEILLFYPENKGVLRFFRPNSNSNTILLTEKCDQTCIMCSQPPKNKDYLHWDLYKTAVEALPDGTVIGITGGEPTLYKRELFDFLRHFSESGQNVFFHILTNGQHFEEKDLDLLESVNRNVLWAVPLYGAQPDTHDLVVGKSGAFHQLIENFAILLKSNSQVELRTCILKQNYPDLLPLSKFVSQYFHWINNWAIMQLEPIGYAILDWEKKFVDTSVDFEILENAVLSASAAGIRPHLFNFPYCSLPFSLRNYCYPSISDWKKKYLEICTDCEKKTDCSGFFDWYTESAGYQLLQGAFK